MRRPLWRWWRCRRVKPSVKLLENSSTFFKKIEETKQCAQLEYYKAHASDDGMEPLFFNIVSWAKRCNDGYEWAQKLGAMHPYAEDRINAKWHATKGPSPCLKLDEVNPGICTSCPHFSKIKNPLVWGKNSKVDNEEKEIVVDRGEEVKPSTPMTAQTPTSNEANPT
jgi:hypothetical protein